MANYKRISAEQAQKRLLVEEIKLVDIRDKSTSLSAPVADAFHLSNASVAQFIEEVDINTTIFVICYHGNSSKGVAQYLCEQGYLDVYSVDGGFADWHIAERQQ